MLVQALNRIRLGARRMLAVATSTRRFVRVRESMGVVAVMVMAPFFLAGNAKKGLWVGGHDADAI